MGGVTRLLDRLRHWARGLFRARDIDRQMDEELQAWIGELTARYRRDGLTPDEAGARARADIGNLQAMKDEVRDHRAGASLRTLGPDFRDAWRSVRRAPALTAAMLATFALGIGATTAIFSVVNAMLIAPLPYRDASRLAIIWSDMTEAGYPRAPLSAPELKDLRDRTTSFDGLGSIWSTTTALTGEGEPEQLRVGLVTSNFFSVLGASAAFGRTFGDEDDQRAATPGIVLSWPVFERRFGADPGVIGKTVNGNGRSLTVIGVMPKDFRLLFPPDASVPDDLQAWICLRSASLAASPRGQQYLRVIGRMKSGVTLESARADVAAVGAAISREFTEYGATGRRFTTVGLQDDDVREIRPALLMLAAGVTILLLIACVNVAGLMLARTAGRVQETAVRLALGAGSLRLFRLHLAEGLIIAALGGLVGVAAGWAGLRAIMLWRPPTLARIDSAGIDLTVLTVTTAITLGWALVLSLAPLSESIRVNVIAALQRTGQRAGSSFSTRARSWLVAVQLALSVILLVGAGLLVRTFINIERRDLGFRVGEALTFRLAVPGQRYQSLDAFVGFTTSLVDRLRALPGASGAAAVSHLPFDHLPNWGGGYVIPGSNRTESPVADYRAVTPEFFHVANVRLITGRFLTPEDTAGRPLVVVVDDLLAARAWPGESPIGKRILVDPGSNGTANVPAEVVGVVGHLRLRSLVEPLAEQVYFSARQALRNPLTYIVTGDPAALSAEVRRAVADVDPQVPIFDVRAFASYVDDARAGRRFMALLTACFAGVAVLLASVGLYGVIAYAVAARRREFGVRLALGARPRQVAGLVLRQGAALAGAGLVIGLMAAAPTALALRDQLVDVAPVDAATYGAAAGILAAVALAACWLPVRRATAVPPSISLRQD